MKITCTIHPILWLLLICLTTSCGRRPPQPESTGHGTSNIQTLSVENLVQQNSILEEQLQTEKDLHRKTEQRLALEQSWRSRWQTMAFIAGIAAVLALLIGMSLGSDTRKEATDTHDNAS